MDCGLHLPDDNLLYTALKGVTQEDFNAYLMKAEETLKNLLRTFGKMDLQKVSTIISSKVSN